jgi:uncharacterized protein
MKVIITGGTGLVGRKIIELLHGRGDAVVNLSTRKTSTSAHAHSVFWDPEKWNTSSEWNEEARMALEAMKDSHAVIHLAGFNVANRWTEANKRKMVQSRLESTQCLIRMLRALPSMPEVFVSAGAIGIYSPSDQWQSEDAPVGNHFLGQLSSDWESASLSLESTLRRVVLRIGVVLDARDGAVAKMLPFFKLGLGSPTGSGKQWMSWIHLNDLARMFVYAVDQSNIRGTYNAVAPDPVTNTAFSKALAKALKKPFFLPAVPAFVLKMLFGEMASMLLVSQRISSQKIQGTGFSFEYSRIEPAFNSLFP